MGSAGRSAAMLLGFLTLAWLQVGAVLLVVLLILRPLPGSLALGVAVPLVIAVAGLLWWATVRALRLRRSTPAGVPVLRRHAPDLWTMLDEASAAAGVQPPDGVTVVAGATLALFEPLRLGGLLGGRRELYLGLPLLQAWDESRLRAAVAHELAHGSPALGGRFAPLARRGRIALGRIVPRIPRRSPAGPLLRAWARLYLRVDNPYSHGQELAADRVAAAFAGPRAAAAVLRDRPALEGLQQLFHAEYLSPGWQTGLVPDDVFGGFLHVLAARSDDMAVLRAREPEPPGEWDPHPPLAARLAALAALTPEGPEAPGQPAGDLVPDLPGMGRALQAMAFPVGGRAVVSWDEFFGVARLAEMEREADASLRALSRAAGTPVTGAAEVLDLAADGRLGKIAETVFEDLPADEVSGRVTNLIALLLALAALRSGVARWRHSWSGTAELVAIDGSYLELQIPAEMAGDPATVGQVREWLTALGVDLTAAAAPSRHHSARVPVLGGVVGVQVDGSRTDLLVLETGLFLVPGLPRSRHHEAKRRLTRLATDGVLTDGTPAGPTPAAGLSPAGLSPVGPSTTGPTPAASSPAGPSAAVPARAVSSPTGPSAAVPAPAASSPAGPSSTGSIPAGSSPADAIGSTEPPSTLTQATAGAGSQHTASTATLPDARAHDPAAAGSRFVPFADVATASATRNGRRSWEINLHDGVTLTVRSTLDSEELPGGWAALDDAVAFLTRTR
ncbi:peptidase [Paractinoplanes maris]|uniref:peptidase n=1 Tax=Paractinoplanes maris TaxID=1734446 RepID=UPI00202059CB|nr:peptidase [Actinoplanes maris]